MWINPWIYQPLDPFSLGSIEPWIYRADLQVVVHAQIVVSEDGACGMNYEHSVAEGIALVQLVEHALNYL